MGGEPVNDAAAADEVLAAEMRLREKVPRWRQIVKRFRKNKTALGALCVLLLVAVAAIAAPIITKHSPYIGELSDICLPPGPDHLLGCDENGRDIFARILYGGRISLTVGFISVGISVFFGMILGMVSAYYGGWIDNIVQRVLDTLMAFPGILLAIVFMSVFGKGVENAILAISIVGIPGVSRVVRGAVLAAKEQDHVLSARAIGCTDLGIMLKHILPNIMAPIIVNATMSISGAILQTAALGFLGLGVQPPTAEWGYMLANGKEFIFTAPHLITFPGIAIAVTVLSFNLFGDGLRDALDPRLK
jgi:peptide/nickel transport system permease protein/oligopeptide transport system permease protein